ncbi:Methylenetetrahydrofolate--tRNA-(uracil-5-)-methyltransferase TrmFO [Bienertia sinuspersici]
MKIKSTHCIAHNFTSNHLNRHIYHASTMLTVHVRRAVTKCSSFLDNHIFQKFSLPKTSNVTPLLSPLRCPSQPSFSSNEGLRKCSLSRQGHGVLKGHSLYQETIPKRWLCRSLDPASSDDEYGSSTSIAISLFKRYRNVIDRGETDNLKEFIQAGVNAYALGCTDEGLRKELNNMKESGVEIESMKTYGGSTSPKSKILSKEVDECIFWLSIIFITILCTPQPTVIRWSASPPVSEDVLRHWKGFCAIIANAYYTKGMVWLPVKLLQLEQMAVAGHAEEPSVVASRMRLVFSTLEVVTSPQWPCT